MSVPPTNKSAPPPPMSRPTVHGKHPSGAPPPPHAPPPLPAAHPPTPGQHGYNSNNNITPYGSGNSSVPSQNVPSQGGASSSYAPSPKAPPAAPATGPKLVGSAAVPAHAGVPGVKRRPSPVRPGNSPTAGQQSGSNPPPPAPLSRPPPSALNASTSNNGNLNSTASGGVTSPPPQQPSAGGGVGSKAPPSAIPSSVSNSSFARAIPTSSVPRGKGPNNEPVPLSASPSRTMSAAPNASVNVPSSNPPSSGSASGNNNNNNTRPPSPPNSNNVNNNGNMNNNMNNISPPRSQPQYGAASNNNNNNTNTNTNNTNSPPRNNNNNNNNNNNVANMVNQYVAPLLNNNNNNTNSPPRSNNNNNNNDTSAMNTAPSPIPLQSSLVASPSSVRGAAAAVGRNVSWALNNNNNNNNNNNTTAVSSNRGNRTLPPPENDAMHTSVIRENIDTVGLHRTDIQDAINNSHYAVSGSQFPLSVVPQSKSKARGMTSTIDGCITIEILVMINGAHGSGYNSKCDEVRIVNVDPARTTIRRLLNLAHKAVNFVPVSRGVLQMSARTLATRRVHNLDKPLITPIPLPDSVSSITEMVTIAEEDLVECIPLRENDVLCWVEADPVVAPVFSTGSPKIDRSLHPPQDMHLIGSPNRNVLASTRLPRAVHIPEPEKKPFLMPERVIDVPIPAHDIEFQNQSPKRELRKEPGNGNASLIHRQISGRIGAAGVSTPSWRMDDINNNNNNESLLQTTTATATTSSRYASSGNNNNNNLNTTPSRNVESDTNYARSVPHSSMASYVNSSLRMNNNNNNNNNSPANNKGRASMSSYSAAAAASSLSQQRSSYNTNQQQQNPISLSSGEVIVPRSEEERRLVDEIRAIRRDIESNRY